jgi:hypothetical protein
MLDILLLLLVVPLVGVPLVALYDWVVTWLE